MSNKYSLQLFYIDAANILKANKFRIEDGNLSVASKLYDLNGDLKFDFVIHYSNDLEYNLDIENRESIFCSGRTPEICLENFKTKILEKLGINPDDLPEYQFNSEFELPN